MAKFTVYASNLVYHSVEVEAENESEAMQAAFEIHEGWKYCESVSWQIEFAEPAKEIKAA